jgi:hypothetical protein
MVLGKAKVISYKNLKKARAKRTAKEKTIEGKSKRGRKRKSPTLEAGALELKTKVAQISEAPEPARTR